MKDYAIMMALIDEGDLRAAIGQRQVRAKGVMDEGDLIQGHEHRGQAREVWMDDRKAITGSKKLAQGFTSIADYAWMVHEHMGWEGNETDYMPSEYSRSQQVPGYPVGGKFLERAIVATEKDFLPLDTESYAKRRKGKEKRVMDIQYVIGFASVVIIYISMIVLMWILFGIARRLHWTITALERIWGQMLGRCPNCDNERGQC